MLNTTYFCTVLYRFVQFFDLFYTEVASDKKSPFGLSNIQYQIYAKDHPFWPLILTGFQPWFEVKTETLDLTDLWLKRSWTILYFSALNHGRFLIIFVTFQHLFTNSELTIWLWIRLNGLWRQKSWVLRYETWLLTPVKSFIYNF